MSDALPLRVTVLDTWDEVLVEAPVTARVVDIMQEALSRAGVTRSAEDYVLKHRGGEVSESATLADAGIVPNAALIVMPRRRQPVR
jgi:hypothetical protein